MVGLRWVAYSVLTPHLAGGSRPIRSKLSRVHGSVGMLGPPDGNELENAVIRGQTEAGSCVSCPRAEGGAGAAGRDERNSARDCEFTCRCAARIRCHCAQSG